MFELWIYILISAKEVLFYVRDVICLSVSRCMQKLLDGIQQNFVEGWEMEQKRRQ